MFVGSSNNSKSGLKNNKVIQTQMLTKSLYTWLKFYPNLENNALASANLILQPPLNVFVARACISVVNPKPASITPALAGALSASIAPSAA